MNKKRLLVYGLALVVLLGTLWVFGKTKEDTLPHSFTITLTNDGSSSSGNRGSQEVYIFKNNLLKYGSYYYHSENSRECKENCNIDTTCLINNNTWVNKATGAACDNKSLTIPTKEYIEGEITSGKINNKGRCHYDTCYEITNRSLF